MSTVPAPARTGRSGHRRRPARLTTALVGACALAGLLGLTAPVAEATAPLVPRSSVTHAAAPRTAADVLAAMTLEQRVGQLFMVGTPATAPSPATLAAITGRHVGNVMLTGRSRRGTAATARVAARLQARATGAATRRVGLLVATDQEGGAVQVLSGPGFSAIPSALEQGRWRPSLLQARAGAWADQLRSAGVGLDLAPVADTVPAGRAGADNPPIGAFDREFGHRVRTVRNHVRAFVRGMTAHGVATAVKHFPGLGRVHANTDTTAGVTDVVTTRDDAYLRPFRTAIAAGAPVVMVSTAVYRRLDPARPAAFSPTVIGRMLRGDLGFRGVVVSDDLANARQVARWSPGRRAVAFVAAGGDLVLTVDPATLPAMVDAVIARARRDAAFAAKVDASALRVLQLKQARGLL